MLHPFVSAGATRRPCPALGGLSASIVAHAAVCVAIASTAVAPAPDRPAQSLGVEHVTFTSIAPSVARRAAVARRTGLGLARAAHTGRARCADVACAEFADRPLDRPLDRPRDLPRDLPPVTEVDLTALHLPGAAEDAMARLVALASDGIEFERGALDRFTGMPQPLAALGGGVYARESVERVAAPNGPNPHPRYPRALLAQRVEDSFDVRFVVDSTGWIDRRSVEFPGAVHPLFAKSVRDALARSRFIPAELAGRHVRQLALQRFTFVLARRGSD